MRLITKHVFGALTGVFLCWILLGISCKTDPQPVKSTSHIRLSDEALIRYNREILKREEQEIEDFLVRYGWGMQRTLTGLRYMIYQEGTGAKATTGDQLRMNYTLGLLNGTKLYSSDSLGPKTCVVGRGGMERGLEEGIRLLKQGDRAKFILPSYLAFGLLGDQKKIPPGATLVYDVEILEIHKSK